MLRVFFIVKNELYFFPCENPTNTQKHYKVPHHFVTEFVSGFIGTLTLINFFIIMKFFYSQL